MRPHLIPPFCFYVFTLFILVMFYDKIKSEQILHSSNIRYYACKFLVCFTTAVTSKNKSLKWTPSATNTFLFTMLHNIATWIITKISFSHECQSDPINDNSQIQPAGSIESAVFTLKLGPRNGKQSKKNTKSEYTSPKNLINLYLVNLYLRTKFHENWLTTFYMISLTNRSTKWKHYSSTLAEVK